MGGLGDSRGVAFPSKYLTTSLLIHSNLITYKSKCRKDDLCVMLSREVISCISVLKTHALNLSPTVWNPHPPLSSRVSKMSFKSAYSLSSAWP